MAKVEKGPLQPPSSAAEGAEAPSRTFSVVAMVANPTGVRKAITYHLGSTLRRAIRRSRPPIPLLPRATASTAGAVRKGPKPATGWGERSRAYKIEGHHEEA